MTHSDDTKRWSHLSRNPADLKPFDKQGQLEEDEGRAEDWAKAAKQPSSILTHALKSLSKPCDILVSSLQRLLHGQELGPNDLVPGAMTAPRLIQARGISPLRLKFDIRCVREKGIPPPGLQKTDSCQIQDQSNR